MRYLPTNTWYAIYRATELNDIALTDNGNRIAMAAQLTNPDRTKSRV